jgi:hypothetical protein
VFSPVAHAHALADIMAICATVLSVVLLSFTNPARKLDKILLFINRSLNQPAKILENILPKNDKSETQQQ